MSPNAAFAVVAARGSSPTVSQDEELRPHVPSHGPGTELKKLLAALGVTSFMGCGCNDVAAQINRWGIESCLANFATIRDWLAEAQASAG